MKLKVKRLQKDSDVTIGALFTDGVHTGWTCEDAVRPPGVKIFGKTAIPPGVYKVVVTFSPHFERELPLLVDVPGFSGIRIHPGNTPADTEGCLLVGLDRLDKSIGRSRLAFEALFTKIKKALANNEPVTVEVV